MDKEQIKQKTKEFALRVIRCVESLPQDTVSRHISGQLQRSGTSVAVNYRASCRAKSTADFISKMGTVEEEADKSLFWMELLIDSGKVKKPKLDGLMTKANEILAIFVASINTARGGRRKK